MSDESLFGEFMPPGAVQLLADQVNADVRRLDLDVQASEATKVGQFRNQWHLFVEEWQNFYATLSGSWVQRAHTANIDTLKDYQQNKLPAWQRSLEAAGGDVAGPGVVPRDSPPGFTLPSMTSVLWGLGLVAVIVVAWNVKAIGTAAKAAKGAT